MEVYLEMYRLHISSPLSRLTKPLLRCARPAPPFTHSCHSLDIYRHTHYAISDMALKVPKA